MDLNRLIAWSEFFGSALICLISLFRKTNLPSVNSDLSGRLTNDQDPLAQGAEDEKPEETQGEFEFDQGENFDTLISRCRSLGNPKVSND